MCNSPQKKSTGNMPSPWHNTSGAFPLFRHETSPTPAPSIGITVCPFGAISYHCSRRWNQKAHEGTFRSFLRYLAVHHPEVSRLKQLQRDPHILGWLADLRSHTPPLAKITIAIRVTFLHRMLEDLAWNEQIPTLAHLLSRADVPRREETSPRPLLPEQDQLIQRELQRRDDFLSNLLLLQRHTGMRIGECVDLALDCLFPLGPDHGAIHVPPGKLKTEPWVPLAPPT